jgi:hypothetical protein
MQRPGSVPQKSRPAWPQPATPRHRLSRRRHTRREQVLSLVGVSLAVVRGEQLALALEILADRIHGGCSRIPNRRSELRASRRSCAACAFNSRQAERLISRLSAICQQKRARGIADYGNSPTTLRSRLLITPGGTPPHPHVGEFASDGRPDSQSGNSSSCPICANKRT